MFGAGVLEEVGGSLGNGEWAVQNQDFRGDAVVESDKVQGRNS